MTSAFTQKGICFIFLDQNFPAGSAVLCVCIFHVRCMYLVYVSQGGAHTCDDHITVRIMMYNSKHVHCMLNPTMKTDSWTI